LFDEKFYLMKYPDAAAARVKPLAHDLIHSAKEGRSPSSLFDTAHYLMKNPEIVKIPPRPLQWLREIWRP